MKAAAVNSNNASKTNFSDNSTSTAATTFDPLNHNKKDVVILLVNAGLWLGYDGLVDAYDRGMSTSTQVKNESVVNARPDIVHQCLLAIFDSELGASGHARVFIHTTKGKTIEVSPKMRPPRTYERFKGLMATLFREGRVMPNPDGYNNNNNQDQQYQQQQQQYSTPLLQILQGTLAPIIPEGATVVGLTNAKHNSNIATPLAVAEYCTKNPVPNSLRGGRHKNVLGYFCIDCRDVADASEDPCVNSVVSLSPYPETAHVQAIRLCEGFQFAFTRQQVQKQKKQQQLQKEREKIQGQQEQQQQHQQQQPKVQNEKKQPQQKPQQQNQNQNQRKQTPTSSSAAAAASFAAPTASSKMKTQRRERAE